MKSANTLYKFFLISISALLIFLISSQVHAGGVKIIVNSGYYDGYYSPRYDDSYRLRNKYYFENRNRRVYGDRFYGKQYYRNKFYGNNYRYNNRNYYRGSRYNCPN